MVSIRIKIVISSEGTGSCIGIPGFGFICTALMNLPKAMATEGAAGIQREDQRVNSYLCMAIIIDSISFAYYKYVKALCFA